MNMPSRIRLMASVTPAQLRSETVLSGEQLVSAVGVSPERLARLIELGLIEPTAPGTNEFTAASAQRLARMLRLHRDLGVHWMDAAIIADLVERLDELEAQLARFRRRTNT